MSIVLLLCFFFNDTATTEIYTLSLHDALPISCGIGSLSETESVTVLRLLDETMKMVGGE